ncbi:hypothetical protein ES708_29810 [subsurface metagenome]
MKKDPIVEEIRNIRQAHAAKFQYDLQAICADLCGGRPAPGLRRQDSFYIYGRLIAQEISSLRSISPAPA